MKFLNNLDLQKNEIQNFRVQNLATAPSNPVVGQHYYNTADNTEYVWNGTKWVDALSQGDYTFTNGISEDGSRNVGLVAATIESIGGVIVGTNIDVNNGTISVKDASTTDKGLIEIATDAEAEAGTDEVRAINAKQLQTKVTKNEAITGATKTKITYDEKGLVTAGADLSEADIPDLHLTKITDVTSTAAEVNQLHEAGAVKADFEKLHAVTADANELNIKKAKTRAKNIKFNYKCNEDEIYLWGDYERLKQVFVNIIKNSVEAISVDGIIDMNLCLLDKKVIITISDNGSGMNQEELSNIKEMFYTTKKNGTGLGIALSNEIILAHNGKLNYESEKEKGTKCIIELPI